MKKNSFYVFLCGLIFIIACKKTKVDNETASSTDYALASQEFVQLLLNINEHASVKKGLYKWVNPGYQPQALCVTDTLSGDTTHDTQGIFTNVGDLPTLSINYANCTGPDSKIRNGSVKIAFTKKFNVPGCIATATLGNYTVNGVSYQGIITITRNSSNSFIYTVAGGICSDKTGTIKYVCNNSVSLFDNGTAGNFNDDYIQVSGNANGTNREGKTFDASIADPLKKRSDCSWITEGTVNITPDGLHTRTLDFGTGACDDIAAFVVDGQTFTVHLRK